MYKEYEIIKLKKSVKKFIGKSANLIFISDKPQKYIIIKSERERRILTSLNIRRDQHETLIIKKLRF